MKTVEFQGTVSSNGQIAIPTEIAVQVPAGQSLHTVLHWDVTGDEDASWRVQGRRQFEAAYAAEDSIYERLIDDAPAR